MSGARGAVNRANSVTFRIWEQIRDRQESFSGVFAWSDGSVNLSPSGEVRMANELWVSGDFFNVLGVKPALGRLIMPADDHMGCGIPGAVISNAFWQSEFAGEASVIGRKLSLNGHAVEVIGVTPGWFTGLDVGRTFQIAVPICSIPALSGFDALNAGTYWWLSVMGRLEPGASLQQASAQLDSISKAVFETSLPANYPQASIKNYLDLKLIALPGGAGISRLRNRYSDPLSLLLSIAGLVLVIACANLANLMLARASAREREIAVRLAIGASVSRIVRQLLTESLLLSVAGAGLGLLVARPFTKLLISFLRADEGMIYLSLPVDTRILAFTAGLALLTCLLFGLAPALRAGRVDPGPALKGATRNLTAGRERLGLRRLLAISQVALSLVLVTGALLFVRSLQNLQRVQTGFQQEGVLVADLGFARTNPSSVNKDTYQQALLDRVQAIPGVLSVADTTIVPIGGSSWSNKTWMDGSTQEQSVESLLSRISPQYFRTLAVPLLAGRDFDSGDTRTSPAVAIVNEAFARRIAGSPDPTGRSFHVEATPSRPETVYRIVGIVRNTKYRSLREEFEPVFYVPLSQDPDPSLQDNLLIRSQLGLAQLAPSIRAAIAEADPGAHFELYELKEQIRDSVQRERMMALLSGAFGALAGLLSAIGLYGVISYLVARRRNEIGIRMTLGADRRRIIGMVLRESSGVLGIGLGLGALLSLAASAFARALLFGVEAYDTTTLLTAVVLLAAVGLAATYLPARRAARLDPVTALREE